MARCPVCNWPKAKCWCPKLKGNCPVCGRELPCLDHAVPDELEYVLY